MPPRKTIFDRATSCPKPHKHAYRTKAVAIEAANREHARAGADLNVYKCVGCRCWHLTSSPTARRKTA